MPLARHGILQGHSWSARGNSGTEIHCADAWEMCGGFIIIICERETDQPMAAKKISSHTKRTKVPAETTEPRTKTTISMSTVYAGYTIWKEPTAPSWHPIKCMRYVFFRMIGGCTVTDAIREIHWDPAQFWHLVDLKRHGPFREEYARAKKLQGRAFADSVLIVAEGRDRITRIQKKRIDRMITKSLRRIAKTKSKVYAKIIFSQLMSDLREHDKIIMTRNKLQMDAAKWIAKTANPMEFSESARIALGADLPGFGEAAPILIQFVGPDGEVVDP